jgi:hypothetical protein
MRKAVTKADLDRELASRVNPLTEFPAGFPRRHQRFLETPSPSFVETASAGPDMATNSGPNLLDDVPVGQLSRIVHRIRHQLALARVSLPRDVRPSTVAQISGLLSRVEEAYAEESERVRKALDLPF